MSDVAGRRARTGRRSPCGCCGWCSRTTAPRRTAGTHRPERPSPPGPGAGPEPAPRGSGRAFRPPVATAEPRLVVVVVDIHVHITARATRRSTARRRLARCCLRWPTPLHSPGLLTRLGPVVEILHHATRVEPDDRDGRGRPVARRRWRTEPGRRQG